MAIFFFLVEPALKREILEWELSDRRKIICPGLGALGGMVVPAAIYVYINTSDPGTASIKHLVFYTTQCGSRNGVKRGRLYRSGF
jgi:Na+/H+ antiporter NhaA